jgi:hypothetical protein
LENRQYSSIAQIALRLPASVGKMPRWITGESVPCIMGRVLPYVNRFHSRFERGFGMGIQVSTSKPTK